jgi:hypothetical protein
MQSGRRVAKFGRKFLVLLSIQLALTCFAFQARADDDDPPIRVARLAYEQGSISLQPAGTSDRVAAGLNRPVTTGDKIWSDNDGRVELQLDGSLLQRLVTFCEPPVISIKQRNQIWQPTCE